MNQTIELRSGVEPVLAFLEATLRSESPSDASLCEEYPLLFQEGFDSRVVQIAEPDGVRCALGVLPRTLVTPNGELNVALVGSVATDPAFRGRGLASQALAAAEQAALESGASVMLLWADDPSFYVRRGYRAVGTEVDIAVTQDKLELLPESDDVRPMRSGDAAAIHALYMQHPVRAERTARETTALLSAPNMSVLVVEREGEVIAYACRGRGADMQNYVHEWAGDAQAVLALIRAHGHDWYAQAKGAGNELIVISPDFPLDVTQALADLGFPCMRGLLGMGKVVDRDAVRALVGGNLSATEDLSDRELLECLLPPKSESQTALEVAARQRRDPAELPLFAFCWGLDSI